MPHLVGDTSALSDIAVFAARLLRLDAQALIRIRAVDDERAAMWSWTSLEVLALRGVAARLHDATDITVRADALAATVKQLGAGTRLRLPTAQDLLWRGPLPGEQTTVLETLSATHVADVVAAAEATFRELSAIAALPQRAGEALLEHIAFTVTADDQRAEVSVRQLIAAARLGFLGDQPARIGVVGQRWIFLAGAFGVIYRSTAPVAVL